MSAAPPDVIDHLAGIQPGSPLAAIRDGRMQARENAQNSFAALFAPAETADMSMEERFAVAVFVTGLHRDATATVFYRECLQPGLVTAIAAEAALGAGTGPYGAYPSPALAAENIAGPVFQVSDANRGVLDPRLVAVLEHTHMLVFHPRDADSDALQRLLDAGWSTTGIVTVSQLVAFLTFQLRAAAGLRTLASTLASTVASGMASGMASGIASGIGGTLR